MSWQQIETAPKDGTEILGWSEAWLTCVVAYFSVVKAGWHIPIGDDGFMAIPEPTHWMPLPEAPAVTSEPAKTDERG